MTARLAIALALLIQIALPTSYYLRDDGADERFAWRMFSARWLETRLCTVEYAEQFRVKTRPRVADHTTDKIWLPLLRRNWSWLIDRFLEHRCALNPDLEAVIFERRCPTSRSQRAHTCRPR